MAAPQLSDIRAHLVTAENPARGGDTLDHERCALLHNFIVEYGWVGSGHSLADLERRSFFERYGGEADAIRVHLDPSLVAFLEAIYNIEGVPGSAFFFWVEGITPPSEMWFTQLEGTDEDEYGSRFLTLYSTNLGICSHPDGINYDQTTCKATMSLGIFDQEGTRPVKDHRQLWFPLETVLSNWIQMIELGKITAVTEEAEGENEKYGAWIWHSYSEAQVDSTVEAFNQLVEAIESRMPAASLLPPRGVPLLSEADLDAASIPKSCFVRSFLTRVRVPRFEFIAPGLLVPHDREAFISKQSFTSIDTSSEDGVMIPPVLLFRATDHTANFDCDDRYKSLSPFCNPYKVAKGDHSVPAGLYSESIHRSDVDNAEEGFRLVLPFAMGGEEGGAKKSDGGRLEKGTVDGLFQHGFKPFGGEGWRAQRMERLFGKWTELVENEVWQVGERGVVGEVEVFKDADRGRWRDYCIDLDW